MTQELVLPHIESADQNLVCNYFIRVKVYLCSTRLGQKLVVVTTKIEKKTKSMIFLTCKITSEDKIIATASGIWKILNKKLSGAGPGS